MKNRLATLLLLSTLVAVGTLLTGSGIPANMLVSARADSVETKRLEIARLDSIGFVFESAREFDAAMSYYNDALRLSIEIGDRKLEADNNELTGFIYRAKTDFLSAIKVDSIALTIRVEIGDSEGVASSYSNLGDSYQNLNRYEKSNDCFSRCLDYQRARHDSSRDPNILNHQAINLLYLGQYDSAKTLLPLALQKAKRASDSENEGSILVSLGHLYFSLDDFQKAIGYYQQSLPILKRTNQRANVGVTYGHLASAYNSSRKYSVAQRNNDSALAIARETGSRIDEGIAHARNGLIDYSRKRYSQAIIELQKALEIYEALEVHERAGTAHFRLMLCWRELNKPRLAIFHGKLAVNAYQDIRRDIHQMDLATQRDYARSKEETYRELADLLIEQGRVPEAEQVIALLKDQETFEYMRGEEEITGAGGKVDLDPEEAEFARRLSELAERIAPTTRLERELRRKPDLSDVERKALSQATADLLAFNFAFQRALPRIEADLASTRFPIPEVTQKLKDVVKKLGSDYAAIVSLVGRLRYYIILITSGEVSWVESHKISSKALNQELIEFRRVLQSAGEDPLPEAKQMYKILFGPVEKHVRALGATTLLWSLDGAVRYVPVAALHDGKQYLCERYRSILVAPSADWTPEPDTARWTALGFGVSDAIGEFHSLPFVLDELPGIIDTSTAGKEGIMRGKLYLNSRFTEQTMLSELRGMYPVVHVASHFQFNPGDAAKSFLLLGDGRKLSVRRLSLYPRIFEGVELLTLSACNTAMSARSDGDEVDGFAEKTRQLGAQSILATLWSVADKSTSVFMQKFYRYRQSNPTVSKSEALRQAQLALLHNTTNSPSLMTSVRSGSESPKNVVESHSYKHPYYWAPFVLMGNSR